jgi:lactate permease
VELPAGSETAKTEATCLPVAPPPGGRTSSVSVALATIAAIFVIYKLVQSSPQTSPWAQSYDPTGHWWFSTICAALPVVVLLGSLAFLRIKAHYAALLGLATTLICAIWIFHMPARLAAKTTLLGAEYGLLPIGWIVLNILFLYQLTCDSGLFKILQNSLTNITKDRRLQLLLIAFSFGSFFEGAAGFGTPVAVTAAVLIGLGFPPLQASGLSLIANTAPVAFGSQGTPLIALQAVTGLDLRELSAQAGRILPFFSVLVPFWMTWVFAGFRRMLEVWPAILVAGLFFAIPQFVMSNFHGPWLVDVVAAVTSMVTLIFFLRFWQPRKIYRFENEKEVEVAEALAHSRSTIAKAWVPWLILSVIVFVSNMPSIKTRLDKISSPKFPVSGVHQMIQRVPPVVRQPTLEPAVYTLNWMTATGSSALLAGWISGLLMGFSPVKILRTYFKTIFRLRYSLLTIAAMLALGYLTRYSGMDATMGLAFSRTGVLYPFFGTLLGWLGVALTGSDTSSNVLFGSLQKISAEQLGLSPVLMASANSCGGVMGKMVDAQSIVVASTATQWYGHEGRILRYVFLHSIVLAALVALLVTLQAYVPFFHRLVVR